MTPELQKLKERAKKEEPLLNVTTDQFEELLYILNQEKKAFARDHRYKDGYKCNNTIAHVTKYYDIAKKKENQNIAREEFNELNSKFVQSLKDFDTETKELEKELLNTQKDRRTKLQNSLEEELNEFDAHWNSAKKQRVYNRSTNNLNVLRRQLSLLLVESRFKEAEAVQKQVNQRTKVEEVDHHELMQSDHDTSLKLLKEKQIREMISFEEDCTFEMEKFRQDRTKLRQGYLNRQLMLKTKEDIISDPDKLWKHGQTERMRNTLRTSINKEESIPSSKMKRSDIKESDVAILALPPLDNRRKSPKKTPKKETE